jgi:hypothetical protein
MTWKMQTLKSKIFIFGKNNLLFQQKLFKNYKNFRIF